MAALKIAVIMVGIAMVTAQIVQDPILSTVIEREVVSIVSTFRGLSVDECTAKCDDLFRLGTLKDEDVTDHLCERTCSKAMTDPDSHQHSHGHGGHGGHGHSSTPSSAH